MATARQVLTASFDELAPRTAYEVWRLRQQVFVVEQDCPYPDLDGRDLEPATRHVVLLEDDAVVGHPAGARRRRTGRASAASWSRRRPAVAGSPRC